MKSKKKKPSAKSVSGVAKKTVASRRKLSTAKPKSIPAKIVARTSAKKKPTAKLRKAVSPVMEATAKMVKGAAKRVLRAVKENKAKVERSPAVKKVRKSLKKAALKIPAILLEGDAPDAPSPSGPGQRYSLGPNAPAENFSGEGELPEAYGTKKLLLTARDPRWLYAHWDLTREQLRICNALSADGHLVLRIYKNKIEGEPLAQIHVHPESRNWFVPVDEAGAKYMAELGYHTENGDWICISVSGATMTPPDSLSEDTSVRFATIPVDVPFEKLISIVKAAVRKNIPLAEAVMQLRAGGFKGLPEPSEFVSAKWTPQHERSLGSLITMDSVRRVWIGSLEITELIRRQLTQGISSAGVAQFSLPDSVQFS